MLGFTKALLLGFLFIAEDSFLVVVFPHFGLITGGRFLAIAGGIGGGTGGGFIPEDDIPPPQIPFGRWL